MTPRRELAVTVVACGIGAVMVLLAAGRGWVVQEVARPGALPAQVRHLTGGELRGWLPALGWVALAAAGALLATRRLLRRLTGAVLVLTGVGVSAGALTLLGSDQLRVAWPALTSAGGLLVVVAGAVAVWRGGRWPAMGARYQPSRGDRPPASGPGKPGRVEELWEALDRGEDPTAR